MASDTIVNELWEITNRNSDKKIEREEFEEELRTSLFAKLKEMSPENSINNINDEYVRSLPIILHQAEANPDSLGQIQGGKFTISSEIIFKAVKTVKYENSFIPNTDEYNQRILNENNQIDMKDVVLTTLIIDHMLENYKNLSNEEKDFILNNWHSMDKTQQDKIVVESGKIVQEDSNISDEDKENNKSLEKTALKETNNKDTELIISRFSHESNELFYNYCEENLIDFNELNEEEKRIIFDEFKKKIKVIGDEKLLQGNKKNKEHDTIFKIQKTENLIEKARNQNTNFNNLSQEDKLEFLKYIEKEEYKNINNFESFPKEIKSIKNIQNRDYENKVKNEIEQIPNAFIQYGFSQEKVKKGIEQYKDYFEKLEEDDLQYLSELTDNEFVSILKEEFQEIEVDDETKNILNIMSNITYHGQISELLTNPEKRKEFFEELENTANMDLEKIQNEITSEKDTEPIKDTELVEIFKQASVELAVGEVEQTRGKGEVDNSAPLPNTEMDNTYIVNGVPMNIDEEWLQFFQEAQERGEDLEQAYEEYKKQEELEEITTTAKTEEKDKKEVSQENVEQEANRKEEIIIDEEETSKETPDEETELSSDILENSENGISELSATDSLKKTKKSKKVAVVEKDENLNLTNVQVFKFNPVSYTKNAGLSMHELDEEIKEFGELTAQKDEINTEKTEEEVIE